MQKTFFTLILTFAVVLVVGCGGDSLNRAEISGKVTFGGKPVDSGIVTFLPQSVEKGGVVGAKIINGEYRLDRSEGPVVGTYTVKVSSVQKTGKIVDDPMMGKVEEDAEMIPEPYGGIKSPLTAEVKPGKNIVDFDIPSK
jgi:hypothetical protein